MSDPIVLGGMAEIVLGLLVSTSCLVGVLETLCVRLCVFLCPRRLRVFHDVSKRQKGQILRADELKDWMC